MLTTTWSRVNCLLTGPISDDIAIKKIIDPVPDSNSFRPTCEYLMNEASYVDFCEDDIVAVDDSLEQFTSREVLENLVNIRERHEATGIIPNCHIFPWIEPLKYRESSFCHIRAKWP